ncbi:MAG: PAC2 family protein [Euryarchaeota archaeon]|nr:PAC2 family protein [Euryarchaeota archaeon]
MSLRRAKKGESPGRVLVSGFPNMRNVSKLAAEGFIHGLDARVLREVPSESLAGIPPRISVQEGIASLAGFRLYTARAPRGEGDPLEVIVATGETQPPNALGYVALAREILGHARDLGVQEIYTVGSLGVPWDRPQRQVVAVSGSPDLKRRLQEAGVAPGADGGPISGIEAILPAYAHLEEVPAALVLVETHWDESTYASPDPRAAIAGVQAISKFLGVTVPTRWLEELQPREAPPAEESLRPGKEEPGGYG